VPPGAPAFGQPAPSPASSGRRTSISKPKIRWKPIKFNAKRRHETVKYAERHYRLHTWQLKDPHVIVEHYTGSQTFSSAFNTFDANQPDLGELPGVCAHFVVDKDGTIYQLVDTGTMCRHTVGLNWTAIGIEHVGTSDREILHDKKQLDASLHLTVWLMQEFGISLGNVIGHNESLRSAYHQERVKSWRCQTHSDWNHHDMQIYRAKAERLANQNGVPIGPRVKRVKSHC
jgi:beta-N-acetylhexosaminidase